MHYYGNGAQDWPNGAARDELAFELSEHRRVDLTSRFDQMMVRLAPALPIATKRPAPCDELWPRGATEVDLAVSTISRMLEPGRPNYIRFA